MPRKRCKYGRRKDGKCRKRGPKRSSGSGRWTVRGDALMNPVGGFRTQRSAVTFARKEARRTRDFTMVYKGGELRLQCNARGECF